MNSIIIHTLLLLCRGYKLLVYSTGACSIYVQINMELTTIKKLCSLMIILLLTNESSTSESTTSVDGKYIVVNFCVHSINEWCYVSSIVHANCVR